MGDSIGQKAFFAAIIGGFNQTRGALLGGVLIGVLENLVGFYVRRRTRKAWRWCCSCSSSCSGPRAARQVRGAQGMNAPSKSHVSRVVLAALRRRVLRVSEAQRRLPADAVCVYLMATFGLNLTVGYAGQMSLGQAAFFGIGAYIAAIALKAGCRSSSCCRSRGRVLRDRARARLSRAARAAPLPRVRDAGLQRARVPRHAQRGEDHRRHVRHLEHPAPVASGCPRRPLAFFYFTLVSLS
jgi:hypothetical protein